MRTTRNIIIALIGLMGIFFTSCNWEQDVAPMLTFQLRDGEKLITIAEMLEYHPIANVDSYDSLPKGTVICGIVVSDDTEGNFYKILNIQDKTGGIQIKIDNKALYNKYKIGQRVYVRCDGLVLGDFRQLPQLGLWVNNGMAAIPSALEKQYIFRDGAVEKEPEPEIITSIKDIDAIRPYINKLVKIEDCYFEQGGKATFSDLTTSTSRTLKLNGGGSLVVRTSNYSSFAEYVLPEGSGDVYGVLTRYNNELQLVIRSIKDLKNFYKNEEVYKADMTKNPFDNGWTNITHGAEWKYLSNSMFQGFVINGTAGSNDSWLISPNLQMGKYKDGLTLEIQQRIPNDAGSPEKMKLYYTNSFNEANPAESDWKELSFKSYPSEFEISTILLDGNKISDNFRIAFRYMDTSASAWYIKSVSLNARVSQ